MREVYILSINEISGKLLKKAIMHSAFSLRKNKKIVDELNVFPVPDGDTGTNMSLTMDQASKELSKLSIDNLKQVADTAAWGSLMGARGNSGVILSQLFRGFSQGVPSHKQSMTPLEFAIAYKKGVEAAYHAVMRPVEGTILTVARETAEKMLAEAKHCDDMLTVVKNTLSYGEEVLAKTPDMLEALKEARVVDAGGKGLIILLSAFLDVLENPDLSFSEYEDIQQEDFSVEKTDLKELEYIYCTELFINGKAINIDLLKSYLEKLGDSLIVVGMEDLVKVHVHTNHPGLVMEKALEMGELSKIKVDNMRLQHREMIEDLSETIEENQKENQDIYEEKELGIIAVSQGEGLNEIFKSMGAEIIQGGQTMNPSTESILQAVEKHAYKNTIILPNNKNIIMTAEQVKQISKKNIYVIPTKSIPQGIAALLAFNPLISIQENIDNMNKALKGVITGEVTYAVRDSKINGTLIKQGDILGIKDGKLTIVNSDMEKVLLELIEKMVEDRQDGIITLYYGQEVAKDDVEKLNQILTDKYPEFDVECYDGGQSLYYYIVSVE